MGLHGASTNTRSGQSLLNGGLVTPIGVKADTSAVEAALTEARALLEGVISAGVDPDALVTALIESMTDAFGPLVDRGLWNASVNDPNLHDGTGAANHFYQVSVGATRNLGSGAITFAEGDFVRYDGSVWTRIANANVANPTSGGAEIGLRIIRGIVNTAGSGSIVEGAGFSVSRAGTGDVTVTFDVAFSDVPAVTFGTKTNGTAAPNLASIHNSTDPTAAAFRVALISIGTGYVDSIFHFIAIGPR